MVLRLWSTSRNAGLGVLVPAEEPRRRRSNPADIPSKEKTSARASEMAENRTMCLLRAEDALIPLGGVVSPQEY